MTATTTMFYTIIDLVLFCHIDKHQMEMETATENQQPTNN